MDLSALVRPVVRSLRPYSAGTTTAQARERYGLREVIKLSSNENPLGTSPRALEALRTIDDASVYVDDDYAALRTALAARHDLTEEHVVVGHGSNDVLATVFAALVEPGDEIVMADPTFSLFPKTALLHGATPVQIPLRDGVHDLDAMAAAVGARTKIVVVCDPNNPTATRVERAAFDRFASALPENVLLIVDQAYREYMPPGSLEAIDTLRHRPATLVTRTMSKLFGLAALRFGYALTDPQLAEYVQRVRLPFNVTLPTMRAVLAALGDTAFVERTVTTNDVERAWLRAQLEAAGFPVYPSAANFLCVRVTMTANAAYEALLARGIVVRSGDGLGLPNHLRITVGTRPQNEAVLAALRELAVPA